MLEKQLLNKLFSYVAEGALKITYWDNTSKTYGQGQGKAKSHIIIKSAKAARAMLGNMSLGFGESYMNGLIDIEGSIKNILKIANENKRIFDQGSHGRLQHILSHNKNIRRRQKHFIQHHYDIGNDFYKLWLDKTMTYSCAYFRSTKDSLELAQSQKVDHVLRKLQLQSGQRLLDIGSGWGTLLITAAKKYGVTGLGITLSQEQLKYSRQAAKKAKVDHLVRFELTNYQDLANDNQKFDRIVSVGMFEHVGKKGHNKYLSTVAKLLVDGGISVLHTISTPEKVGGDDPWIAKYIFPGGYIPAVREVVSNLPKNDLRLIDYESLRMHYSMTLDEWAKRFESHKQEVIKMFDERFYRMWRLYLQASSGNFCYGHLDLSQFVLTKGGNNDFPLTREFLYPKKG